MEKRVLREAVVKMHVEQQVERKKAVLLSLLRKTDGVEAELPEEMKGLLSRQDIRNNRMFEELHIGSGVFPGQLALPNYFRGENAYYPDSKSTAYRGQAQREEFAVDPESWEEIRLTVEEKTSGAEKFTVVPEIIKANYGFLSEWMNFTSDFDEALFYACCTYDAGAKAWRPLTERDFAGSGCAGGADCRYGVIYMADAADPRFYEKSGEGSAYNVMIPAGAQPMMKGVSQYAYAMRLRREDDLAQDKRFDRLVFEHSEKLCRDIYEKMNGGESLFQRARE